ncbi:MAG: type I-E CRISPR-associated protein Cas5/CasD [Methyloversatilis sp. 12-65-5]|nr:MAG: type I-E CRISPR-associated protein Cas5/CasD [Methyloversatilis sp. 12-65-5]
MAPINPELIMETFTVRDLRERTGELIRGAEEGRLSVVTKHGTPVFIAVPFDETLLRDYHTAQVPSQAALKKRPHASRRDELAIPGHDLNTILSTRDYRQGAACVVAVEAGATADYSLEQIADALRKPRYTLYLGRKSCPPGAPLYPQVIEAADAEGAFETYLDQIRAELARHSPAPDRPLLEAPPCISRLAWGINATVSMPPDLITTRKDHPLRRNGWMFGDRTEYVALISQEG